MTAPRRTTTATPLSRAALAARTGRVIPVPKPRIVHLGLGAFHRAHQAWYTARVDDAAEWGIAAFTGRSPELALDLAQQDGLYTLTERSDDTDTVSVVGSIVEAVDGTDLTRFAELLAAPETAIVTLTVTEAGYRVMPDGKPDLDDPAVATDVVRLRGAFGVEVIDGRGEGVMTTLGRLLLGLEARRRAGAGAIAIVACDNMPKNGDLVSTALLGLARMVSMETADWIKRSVSFVSTSVDRITPKASANDIATVAELSGWQDTAPVVTEPFSDWVLSGSFPAGRPAWERAGALFVDDIEPFERRKLWLLNGAHSLLAYTGLLRGHTTVASAIGDPRCRDWVEDFWDSASRHLPEEGLALDDYRTSLLDRFHNGRIDHRLVQIASEGVTKLRVRVAPTVLAERQDGRNASAGVRALGSWVALVLSGRELTDGHAAAIAAAAAKPGDSAVDALVGLVDERLVADKVVMAALRSVVAESDGG